MRTVEIESREEFDEAAAHAASLTGWRVQDVDLRGYGDVLAHLDVAGSLFLGCYLDDPVADDLRERGALVFPRLPQVPFDPYRGGLYTPDELYAGLCTDGTSYEQTPDAVVYAWSRQRDPDLVRTLATALHDHSIDDALAEFVRGRRLVGVMGGHALKRGEQEYADAARLGRALARAGLVVATGGGPGAMEAANLGAYLAGEQDAALPEALEMLSRAASFRPSVGPWAAAAFEVRRRWPAADGSPEGLGVPTWFYGHEPPNAFASRIAKYFKNAIREDVLLHCCNAGIVFLPGSGGTVQEIFQDACENYYADPGSVRPMVLVGAEYWTSRLPVWPLLESLARQRAMSSAIHLVDDVSAVAPLLS
ncbi:MAG TPA: Rossmann fold nucleotide-binding protein [Nocardioidaceae bacterium]|nr:Rossmann fold nucleotide-binding protein [Nocardioidaceae bacterium]